MSQEPALWARAESVKDVVICTVCTVCSSSHCEKFRSQRTGLLLLLQCSNNIIATPLEYDHARDLHTRSRVSSLRCSCHHTEGELTFSILLYID